MLQRGTFCKVKVNAVPTLVTHQVGFMPSILEKLLQRSDRIALVTVVRDTGIAQVSIDSEITWYRVDDLEPI